MKKLLLGMAVALAANAYGVTIEITNVGCGSLGQSDCDNLTAEINSELNKDLPEVSIGEYGTGIANGNAFAYKGMTSDYSDNYDLFMVRGMAGAAVEGDLDNIESANGFGIGAAVTVGVNFDVLPIDKIGPVDLSKLDIMVSFMDYTYDDTMDEAEAELNISAFSVMARYQIIDGIDFVPGSLLSWGGVHLHTGIQRSSFTGKVTQTFEDQTVESGGASASLSGVQATFDIDATTTVIPVEVSTFLRAGYVFTVFGGAGFDLVTGSTDVSLDAGGSISGTGGYTADANANESDSGDADPTNFRAFAGLQINLPVVRLTVQANKGLGNDLFGVATGVKIAW